MVEETKNTTNEQPSLLQDIIKLLLKIAVICLCFVLIFSFLFGAFRYEGMSMTPSVKDGDMVLTYRLDKKFKRNDLTVFWYEGQPCVGRVIAFGGDTVDITSKGIMLNGAILAETEITKETTQVKDAVQFPLEVPDGEIFVLGDNREMAIDSRTFGCVAISQTEGKVIGLFRHRGL